MYKFKVPYRCLPKIVQNTELLKAYCIYGKLKYLTNGIPYWKNYKSTKQELSKKLGISENTLRKYIGVLKAYGLAWEEKRNLRLAHKYKIYESLGLEIHINERTNKIATLNIQIQEKDLYPEFLFKELITLKKKQITFKQKEHILNILKQEVGQIYDDRLARKMYKTLKKKVSSTYEKLSTNNDYNFKQEKKKYGFLDNNCSLSTYSKMLGKKAKSTSRYWIKKLEDQQLVIVEQRAVALRVIDKNESIASIREELGKNILIDNGLVYLIPTLSIVVI